MNFRIRRRLTRFGIPVLDINARTRSHKVMASRERLVDQLVSDSQVEVLKALAAGTLAIELVEAYAREHGMAGAGLAAQVRLSAPLWDAIESGEIKLPGGKSMDVAPADWFDIAQFLYKHIDGPPVQNVDVTSGGEVIHVTLKSKDD